MARVDRQIGRARLGKKVAARSNLLPPSDENSRGKVQNVCGDSSGCFCGTRTREDFGLTWKSYSFDHFVVYDTAYEGVLYEGKVKTEDSRARIPIPLRIRPYIGAWRQVCPDTSPDVLMFPAKGHLKNKGKAVPFRAKNFFKWRVWPITDKLKIPRKVCTFQVFRRTLGTDLQKHGTMKDAQAIMRHKHIKTTAEVYMDHIPESVRKAIDSRTDAIFALRKKRRRKSSRVLLNIAGQPKTKLSVN